MDVSISGQLPRALRRLGDRNTRYLWIRQNAYLELLHSKRTSAVCITALDAAGQPLAGSLVVLANRRAEELRRYLLSIWPDLDGQELRQVAERVLTDERA